MKATQQTTQSVALRFSWEEIDIVERAMQSHQEETEKGELIRQMMVLALKEIQPGDAR